MVEPDDLIQFAMTGNSDAYTALAGIARDAGERGVIRPEEAQAAATLWEQLSSVLVRADNGEELGAEEQLLNNAARGNLAAIDRAADELLFWLGQPQAPEGETLCVLERILRAGAATGNAVLCRRLAGVLLKRADYEYAAKSWATAETAVTEAAVLLNCLVDTGETALSPWLAEVAKMLPPRALARATVHRPTMLFYVQPQGSC